MASVSNSTSKELVVTEHALITEEGFFVTCGHSSYLQCDFSLNNNKNKMLHLWHGQPGAGGEQSVVHPMG